MMNMKHWIWFLILILKMNKSEHYQKYADYTAMQTVNTGLGWMSFLDTMAQNSKRSMPELLLIHFQRPEAIDCRTYKEWMQSGCRVRRGAIGIAVPDRDNPSKMQYLFGRDALALLGNERRWKFNGQQEGDILRAMEVEFGSCGSRDFRGQVEHAVNLVLDKYWDAYETDIIGSIMDCTKGWGEYNAKLQFMDAAYFSACYMILQRCGKNPRYSYYESDFFCVKDFASPKAMATLGEAVRSVGGLVLDVIGKAISEKARSNTIVAEGEKSPSAFLGSKSSKNEMEVR